MVWTVAGEREEMEGRERGGREGKKKGFYEFYENLHGLISNDVKWKEDTNPITEI